MSTVQQLGLICGAAVGLGLVIVIWALVPTHPHAGDTLARLGSTRLARDTTRTIEVAEDRTDALGLWAQKWLPAGIWGTSPTKELALLRKPLHRYYGERVMFFLIGMIFPPMIISILILFGYPLPFIVPIIAGLAAGVAASFIPAHNAASDARDARIAFNVALGAYLDNVAGERVAGRGAREALEKATNYGDSWVFQRLREQLKRSRWSNEPPWESLEQLADELGLPDLTDLADILRLSGESGAQVADQLHHRAASMRNAMLNDATAKANAAGERMVVPVALMVPLFILLIVTPSVLRAVGLA